MSHNICAHPWQQMIINIDGSVYPCCFWDSYQNGGGPIGNTNESSIEEIWNSPRYQELRWKNLNDNSPGFPCHDCMAKRMGEGCYPQHITTDNLVEDSLSGQNYLRNKQEFEAGAIVLESKPIFFSYVGTVACNIRCTFCNQYTQHLEGLSHRPETREAVLNLIPYLIVLAWQGGEAFLDPYFKKFLTSFRRNENPNLRIAFPTNGMLSDRNILATLCNEFTGFQTAFSIDSFNKETYEKLRFGASFERVMDHLLAFIDAVQDRPNCGASIQACVMKSTMSELTDNITFAVENNIGFSLSPVIAWPPHEMLNCFTNYRSDSQGWKDEVERAIAYLEHLEEEGNLNFRGRVFAPMGTLLEIRRLLGEQAPRYVNPQKVHVVVNDIEINVSEGGEQIQTIVPESGFCWMAPVATIDALGLGFELWEDGKPIGTHTDVHEEIRSKGEGRHSLWPNPPHGHMLFFSTSDNSDPRTNGRKYLLHPVITGTKDRLGRTRRPAVVIVNRNDLNVPVGYLMISEGGEFTIDIPSDFPMEEMAAYFLDDILNNLSKHPVHDNWHDGESCHISINRITSLVFTDEQKSTKDGEQTYALAN